MTLGNATVDIWVVLVVILSVGMVALLASTLLHGFRRFDQRIVDQNQFLGKLEGKLDQVNGELTNLKIDQATVRAVQTKMGEFHPQAQVSPASPPVYIIQQPIPWTPGSQTVQNPYPGNPPYPNPQGPTSSVSYPQPGPAAYQGKPPGASGNIPRPIISERKVTVPPPPPRQAPQPRLEPQRDINSETRPEPRFDTRPETRTESRFDPRLAQQPMPESQGKAPTVAQDLPRERTAPIPQQVQVVEPKPVFAGEPPRKPIRTVGFTEFQLPDEDELFYESHQQSQPIEKAEVQPTQSQEATPTQKAQPIFSSKFYSLHDSMTHSGKQYSEEELDQKILD